MCIYKCKKITKLVENMPKTFKVYKVYQLSKGMLRSPCYPNKKGGEITLLSLEKSNYQIASDRGRKQSKYKNYTYQGIYTFLKKRDAEIYCSIPTKKCIVVELTVEKRHVIEAGLQYVYVSSFNKRVMGKLKKSNINRNYFYLPSIISSLVRIKKSEFQKAIS